ncbi:hypothetical protein GXW71_07680 [Roseomonas hellenica]|uniref:TadE-like domain-containing protein n=1 Tax=Plastoroseomonas hellenica TaxID=2687306 RepID=A0ABS5EVC6_9PROT|nr:TadE/TadG family type IV pilus assembly protein [Plastoroseomonas hellenica]MBR0664234.1 hypothetical protein [Plastoroseomonas hellenica]
MSRIEGRGLGCRGTASVELALVALMLVLLLLGLVDLVLQMRAIYRVERMAGEIANAIAQLDPVTRSGINAILAAAPSIGGRNIAITNTVGNDGAIYVAAFGNENGSNKRLWGLNNYTSGSPPTAVATRLGSSTSPLPGGVIVPSGVQLLAVEVVSQRVRWTFPATQALIGGSAPAILYAVAVARPRTATLAATLP